MVACCLLLVACMFICVIFSDLSSQAFLAAQVHYACCWFNDGIDMGATILVMSVALEVCMFLSQQLACVASVCVFSVWYDYDRDIVCIG